ncbi:hypothetical protein K3495_g189 [Podosphaera aphanis]|nr:hypothetical protein K3495_g189 [Podosphaera aphanis]
MPPKVKASKANDSKGKKGDSKEKNEKATSKVKGAQQINVRHILCEKHSKKEEALQRLKNGDKFDEVAREMSEDKSRSGGSLGWKKKGDLDPAFEALAFGLEVSTTTNPNFAEVKTQFGYHILMVEGRK